MISRIWRYLRAFILGRVDYYDDLTQPRAEDVRARRAREQEVRDLISRCARDPEEAIEQLEQSILNLNRQAVEAGRLGADDGTIERYRAEINRRRADLAAARRLKARIDREEVADRESIRAFVFRGRNQRGVPLYEGKWRRPSRIMARLFVSMGIMHLLAALMFITDSSVERSLSDVMPSFLWGSIALALGAVWIGTGIRKLKEREEYDSLFSIDELCRTFDVPELTLLQEARGRGIAPKRIVNGREYFDFQEFGEAAILLRATKPDDASQQLLRPAASSATEPDILLRTVGQNDSSPDN
jgi:hypothetical protein